MNEVELIRAQLSLERHHAMDVARGLAAAGEHYGDNVSPREAFRQAGVDYLVWILSRFEAREQVFHDLLRARFAPEDTKRRAVEAALALPGTSREALARLETALATASDPARWVDFLNFFTAPWSTRRNELDKLFAQQATVTDWRTVSGIDADSILDERTRYARFGSVDPSLRGQTPSSADSL
jgi:hypothetical protein